MTNYEMYFGSLKDAASTLNDIADSDCTGCVLYRFDYDYCKDNDSDYCWKTIKTWLESESDCDD